MRLPTPREPECSITHTRSASSRHTSMKWLPVPSVPRWSALRLLATLGCLSTMAARPSPRGAPRWVFLAHASAICRGTSAPGAAVPRPAVVGAAVRHRGLDGAAQRRQVVGQLVRREAGLHGHHAAADVDADGGRDDRALARNDAADRGAEAPVHVGHGRHVAVDERQAGDVAQLLRGLLFERHALGPRLDGHALGLDDVVGAHDQLFSFMAPRRAFMCK